MSRLKFIVFYLCILSLPASAVPLQAVEKDWFSNAWDGAKRVAKTIADSVREIKPFELQMGSLFIPVGKFGSDYHQQMGERRTRIKAIREELIEANRYVRPSASKSSEELQSELFSLLALGSLPEEDKGRTDLIESQWVEQPLLLQRSGQAQSWEVPGMWSTMQGGSGAGGNSGSGTTGKPAALQPDGPATACEECKKSFGITRWKYHCLTCGEVVCDDCLIKKIPTVGYPEAQKACTSCVKKYEKAQQARPEEQRVQELCDQFAAQVENSTSGRDKVLSVAGHVLGALSSVVPAPFGGVVSAAQKIVSLAQTAASNTAESQRLADRVARLNMAMMKLSKQGDSPLAQRAARDLKKAFDDGIKLLSKFQPDPNRGFIERLKVTWKQYSENTVNEFNDIHNQLTQIMQDRAFALSLEDQNRMAPPSLDQIKEGIRAELSHVTEEIKRLGQESGQRFTQLEESLQQLLDRQYGGVGHRTVVLLDPNVVRLDANSVLGAGAFGVVRSGTLYGSIPVAIKQLDHCSGNVAETLQREVEQMMRVSHPNVVKVHGLLCKEDGKTPMGIVMERLGESLETVAFGQGLRPEQKMKYTQDLIAGMGRVHEGRLVHCDLKPANILLTENKHTAKIIDFGISQGRSTIIFSEAPRSRGTVRYMAPEVLSGQRLGLSCDVYSFGVLLYELWSGQSAWETYSEDQIRINVQGGTRPATQAQMLEEGIPAPIVALIESSWRQTAGERPTFRDMAQILEIEDFWETVPARWPSFLPRPQSISPQAELSPLRIGTLPSINELMGLRCDQLCQVLEAQDIHEDIVSWWKEKKYNGANFVQSGSKIVEKMKQSSHLDEIHLEAFENLQQKVAQQAKAEEERARVRAEASQKAQLEAERQAAQRRVVANLEAQRTALQGESEQRNTLQAEENRVREDLRQRRTSVGAEIAKRIQEAYRKAEEDKKAQEAQQAEQEKRKKLEAEQAEANRKKQEAEAAKRVETARQEAERARLAASRPAANVARTTAMTTNPLKRVGNWYKGPREAQSVRALEWELGRKGSKAMTFKEAQAYAESRRAEGWRLPTIWELEALYQQKDALGNDLDTGYFWSDTAVVGVDVLLWYLNFSRGHVGSNPNVQVRLVRG